MAMNGQDYEIVATEIANGRPLPTNVPSERHEAINSTLDDLAHDLAEIFRHRDPHFNREKFLDRCHCSTANHKGKGGTRC